MKRTFLVILLGLNAVCTYGQGTLAYDQQSSTDETPPPFGTGGSLQAASPGAGQSFIPALSSVGFVRFLFDDGNTFDGLGTTIAVNLRSGSISGTILDTTLPVTMPNGFAGATTFTFPSAVPVSPGVTYYFEPFVQSGGTWNIISGPYNYPGGTAFANGIALGGSDLWFREGIIVPEPSAFGLLVLAGCSLLCFKNRKKLRVG